MAFWLVALLLGLTHPRTTTAAPTPYQFKPVITTDFPDPALIKDNETWYALASQSRFDYKETHIQVAKSADLDNWTVTGEDALPKLPAWIDATAPKVWAPHVSKRHDGTFVLFYTAATTASNARLHCIGVATSADLTGPYHPVSDKPFICPADQGGAIDPFLHRDSNGHSYLVYKVDGNSLNEGGGPLHPTPIMLQQVSSHNLTTPIGNPIKLLSNEIDNGEALVEAPALGKQGSKYVLFFSNGWYNEKTYTLSVAVSDSLTGPFVRVPKPLFETGTHGLIGPGSVGIDGSHAAWHGYASDADVGGRRALYVAKLDLVFAGAESL